MVILNLTLKTQDGKTWTDLCGSVYGPLAGFLEQDCEPSVFIKCRKFTDLLGNH